MREPDIKLRLCNGGMVELIMGGGRATLSTPDQFAESTILREVKGVLETNVECRVLFGDAGIGTAQYIGGKVEWFKEDEDE